jgi:4-hydroxy-4-methyl-2-oxoglutarate aldolase
MEHVLSTEQLDALRAYDTPTICNAIERFKVRGRVEGFMGMGIRCLLPSLGIMVGYAVTVTVDSTTPGIPRSEASWLAWLKAMEAAPKPTVLVFKDVGPQVRKSAHFGEVMGTTASALGVIGIVTDGGLRDIVQLERLGLHCFGPGLVPSHGNPRLLDVNVPVDLDGVRIEPGDLLHGDQNGVTVIPSAIADRIPAVAAEVCDDEAVIMNYIKGPDFTVDGLFRRQFKH